MSLRVLLADESLTIKKVLQLALQDYDVEISTVLTGNEAVEAAEAFLPDIVFADVLLSKRNGYEVCLNLKTHSNPQIASIPVVLMWSSFISIDEKNYILARADGRLEKPFETESLRRLVRELVPKTSSHVLGPFLRFNSGFIDDLNKEEAEKKLRFAPPPPLPLSSPSPSPSSSSSLSTLQPLPPSPRQSPKSSWNMDSFDDPVFSQLIDEEKSQPNILNMNKAASPTHLANQSTTDDDGEDETDFSFLSLAQPLSPEALGVNGQHTGITTNPSAIPTNKSKPFMPPPPPSQSFQTAHGEEEQAQQVQQMRPQQPPPSRTENWEHQSLDDLRHKPKPLGEIRGVDGEMIPQFASEPHWEQNDTQSKKLPDLSLLHHEELEKLEDNDDKAAPRVHTEPLNELAAGKLIQPERMEQILRSEIREALKNTLSPMIRELLPSLAQQLIQNELDQLLQDPVEKRSPTK